MTTNPEQITCDDLQAWWAAAPESVAHQPAALPAPLAAHVRECLACYRLSSSWRELPKQEQALRALLREDESFDEDFWRELPARVYAEVQGATTAPAVSNAPTPAISAAPRRPRAARAVVASALGAAAAAALLILALPRLMPLRGEPATARTTSAVNAAAPALDAPSGAWGDLPSEDTSFVGALADLGPQELEALLGDEEGALDAELGTEDGEMGELADVWERTANALSSGPTPSPTVAPHERRP